jgi:hypothetical protein
MGRDGKNSDVLFRYILHRLHALTFTDKPNIPSHDSVFIPSGMALRFVSYV